MEGSEANALMGTRSGRDRTEAAYEAIRAAPFQSSLLVSARIHVSLRQRGMRREKKTHEREAPPRNRVANGHPTFDFGSEPLMAEDRSSVFTYVGIRSLLE